MPDAHALSLGRVTVQSTLGEPLRAEIDLPQISAEELASLTVSIGSPDTFRAAGLDYSPVLGSLHISFQRRANGATYLRLLSDRIVNEPFIDLIIEANWSTGRIVRDYTLLFDPPATRGRQQPLAAQVPPAVRERGLADAAPAGAAEGRGGTVPAPTAPTAQTSAPAPTADNSRRLNVQAGDTAGRLAAAHKTPSVSLDQMLVALLQQNPQAFVNGNMNRLKAGAVLALPSAEQASAISPGEARQTVLAQSRDFNEFRRRLAEAAPQATAGPASRQAAGRLQAEVTERRPAADTPDRLSLSKAQVQGLSPEERIAQERAARDGATRVAELNRNLEDLNRLTAAAGSPAPSQAGPANPPPPGIPLALPGGAPAAQAAPSAAPSSPSAEAGANPPTTQEGATTAVTQPTTEGAGTPSEAPTETTTAPPAAPTPPPATPPVPRATQPSVFETLADNPLLPAAGAGLLALLLGLGFVQWRRRRKNGQVDSSFLESRLQPDSFFGASGGQRIDTAEGASVTGSSMVYSPSQLDAAGDVDPVAEADVYLAYGRDLQAEEILKEALRTTPQRVAIHAKLLEIYAKRGDLRAFEHGAREAHALTQGRGPEWDHIADLGQSLDPANPMYRSARTTASAGAAAAGVATLGAAGLASAAAGKRSAEDTAPSGFDFELPADLLSPPSTGVDAQQPSWTASTAQPVAQRGMDLDLDLDLDEGTAAPPAAQTPPAGEEPAPGPGFGATAAQEAPPPLPELDFGELQGLPSTEAPESSRLEAAAPLDFALGEPTAAPAPSPARARPFDLDSLDLDLDLDRPVAAAPARASEHLPQQDAPEPLAPLELAGFEDVETSADPLATKLALAEEFQTIGDTDGARSLAQEVLDEASGDLRERAQRFLAEIG